MDHVKLQSRLEALVADRFPQQDEPGCAVLAITGVHTLYVARGQASLDPDVPVTSRTNFRLASVAKQFTAAAILSLWEEGALSLEQPMTDFFPQFPAYGATITVEHLLRHTSGIKDYEPLVAEKNPPLPVLDAQVLALLAEEQGGDFAAGDRFRYSNSGYAVLAQIVEVVSGEGFPQYLKRKFFDPLGMEESLVLDNRPGKPAVPNRAMGFNLEVGGVWMPKDQSLTSAVMGDGGVYTSVEGYAKWIRAYMGGRALKPETVRQAWTPGVTTGGELVPYGYGWRLEPEERGGGIYWRPYHPGSTTGFRNGVVVNYENNTAALVLTNRCNGDAVALAKAVEGELRSAGRLV